MNEKVRKSSENVEDHRLLIETLRLQIQKPRENAEYYFITLLGNDDGTVEHSVYTQFAGYTEIKPRREIRVAGFVNSENLRSGLNELKEPNALVNDEKDLYIFLIVGGHGIIEKSLAEKYLPNLLKPKVCIQSFSKGFLHAEALPKQKVNHAPTKKVRMNVLKRDNFRCRTCGRSPDNHVDIELHVHHILPWGHGGITEEDNLITLCSSCHDGLDPHYEMKLFDRLGIGHLQDAIGDKDSHRNGLIKYLEISKRNYFEG